MIKMVFLYYVSNIPLKVQVSNLCNMCKNFILIIFKEVIILQVALDYMSA